MFIAFTFTFNFYIYEAIIIATKEKMQFVENVTLNRLYDCQ